MRRSRADGRALIGLGLGLGLGLGCGGPGAAKPASPRCPMAREVVLAGPDDIAAFAGCTTASSLAIRTAMSLDLAPLRSLQTITGDLTIGPSVGLSELTLHELVRVGGAISIASNNDLRGVFLPRLREAGRIAVDGNVSLGTLSLPALETVTGSLVVTGAGDLELVDMNALAQVGKELVLADNPKLVLVEAAGLTAAGSVRVDNNPLLPDDTVYALRTKAR